MWPVVVLLAAAVTAVAVAAVRCYAGLREIHRAERLAAGKEFDLEPVELALLAENLTDLTVMEMYGAGRPDPARTDRRPWPWTDSTPCPSATTCGPARTVPTPD
ncbi:hypothetical protein [Kitasatospora sp. NPDC101183]|uniref:hypothetical protein n=1 Tax=Kitasatospora sp. NPDC101183 TaxID=3364100 RepID=UPI0037F9CDB4